MTLLITGGTGKLGQELHTVFPEALIPPRKVMDITDKEMVCRYFGENPPSTVIHTAALTNVRTCQENWTLAEKVNVNGTWNVLTAAEMIGAKVIYISTACVFPGEYDAPYDETDRPDPKNYYALTKYAGEQLTKRFDGNLIIRTNFVPYEPWPYPQAFTDRYGTYLYAHDVAHAIQQVMSLTGIVHICGSETMSMYQLAKRLSPKVKPLTLKRYTGPPLTRDMRLTSIRIPPFQMTDKVIEV